MDATTFPSDRLPRLYIRTTLFQACTFLRSNWRHLAKAAVLPTIALSILYFTWGRLYEAREMPSIIRWIASAVYYIPLASFSVACHRTALVMPAHPVLGRRELLFSAYLFLFSEIGSAPVPGTINMMLLIAAALLLAYIIARLSLVFPAVAIGDTGSLFVAWNRSRRAGFALLGIGLGAGIIGSLTAAPLLILQACLLKVSGPTVSLLQAFLSSGSSLLVTAAGVAGLSMAYKALSGPPAT